MRHRRLALALPGLIAVAVALALASPLPSIAANDATYSTANTTGASRTLPNGQFAYSDGCRVGYDNTTEFRCAFEFALSIPSSATILKATLKVQKTAGCPYATDCYVDVYAYQGNGSSDLTDVNTGALVRIYNPNGSALDMDVTADLQTRVTNGIAYVGYNLRRHPENTHNPDFMDFDISGSTKVKLTVSYVAQPVRVTVHLGGTGDGEVVSSPAGINCGESCTTLYEYAEPVTLTATELNGASFDHWSGGECDGSTNPVCEFIVPPLDMETTAIFTGIGPPVSAPPNATPKPTPTQLTPAPLPTAGPSGGPGPIVTLPPLPTDVVASDGTIITPPPPTQAAVADTVAPTIVGLDGAPTDTASGGIGLPIVILLILVLGGVVGGGVYWYTKRRQDALPPPTT